ncbi:MAG: UbiA family prenyltransferase [Bacteroidota bacterium]|nr:UbiA family prenyltransferase [Candidatus Kapabacteria bacterium]MCS7301863.1 UbiA family prenyltransferase [Candidatus Kapabacteria bacterium]MCX7936116.1 UbiA family prenyltransferase [Chlorobiota bacterium]MDW8074990.1 UbiA family prenyltransferase [Bacteroidota bacterium]MDW8271629.1 UbiA family prenyltransferase [Bacteroidota bacterium]
MNSPDKQILVVDLDETLLRTDLVWEALTELARCKPYLLLLVPLVLFRGRAALKQWLSRQVRLELHQMPLNESVRAFVAHAKAQGRTVVLATAAHRCWVEPWARELGYFDHIFATEHINLRGRAKLERLKQEFPAQHFDYIGNSGADVPLWRAATNAYIAGNPRLYQHRIGKAFAGVFPVERARFGDWLGLLRIEQWSKNLLVFVPLVLAHRLGEATALINTAIAGLLLSIIASALYVLNDLLDLPRDRLHPTKSARPLARGIIPLRHAWIAVGAGVVIGGGWCAVLLPPAAALLIALYGTTALAYSLRLKHLAVVDTFVLSALYTLRILIGAAASSTPVSPWLIGFALTFFTGLALLKRHSETVHLRMNNYRIEDNRPYTDRDEPFLLATGIATSTMAIVILTVYLTSERVRTLYSHPERLWLVLPLLLFWLMRMWRLSVHGQLTSDPLSFALRDRISLTIAAVLFILVVAVAR